MISNADLIARLPDPEHWERIAAEELHPGDTIVLQGNTCIVIGAQYIYTRGCYSVTISLQRSDGTERAEISLPSHEPVFVYRPQIP